MTDTIIIPGEPDTPVEATPPVEEIVEEVVTELLDQQEQQEEEEEWQLKILETQLTLAESLNSLQSALTEKLESIAALLIQTPLAVAEAVTEAVEVPTVESVVEDGPEGAIQPEQEPPPKEKPTSQKSSKREAKFF